MGRFKKQFYTVCIGIGLNMLIPEYFDCIVSEKEISKFHK